MAFDKEPVRYEKTVLSDLQGAWQDLRDTVVERAREAVVASNIGY